MKYYLWAFIWAIFVLIMVSVPVETGGTPTFAGMDKLVHTGFFFVFTILLFFGDMKNSIHPKFLSLSTITIFTISSGFAFLTEIVQKMVFTYRSFEWWDIFADLVGIGMGLFAYLVFVLAVDFPSSRKPLS